MYKITDLIRRYGAKGTFQRFLTKSMSLFGFDVRYNFLMEYSPLNSLPEDASFSGANYTGKIKQLQFNDLYQYGDKSWFSPQKLEYEKNRLIYQVILQWV